MINEIKTQEEALVYAMFDDSFNSFDEKKKKSTLELIKIRLEKLKRKGWYLTNYSQEIEEDNTKGSLNDL